MDHPHCSTYLSASLRNGFPWRVLPTQDEALTSTPVKAAGEQVPSRIKRVRELVNAPIQTEHQAKKVASSDVPDECVVSARDAIEISSGDFLKEFWEGRDLSEACQTWESSLLAKIDPEQDLSKCRSQFGSDVTSQISKRTRRLNLIATA